MDDDRIHQAFDKMAQDSIPTILTSRYAAFEGLSKGWIEGQISQCVLTGESGSGKSWLWRKAAETARTQAEHLRWISAPCLPGSNGAGLLQSLRYQLEDGWAAHSVTAEESITYVERKVTELAHDGYRLEVVVEESHHLEHEGFEVIRILQERLRYRGIRVGVLFVGQTRLLQKYTSLSRQGRPVGWHLSHLSLSETLEMIRWARPELSWARAEADWIHRETLGNPRRIIRWSETWQPGQPTPAEHDSPMIKPGARPSDSKASAATTGHSLATWSSEPLLPVKPPLEESEGLIEVGYDESDEHWPASEPAPSFFTATADRTSDDDGLESSEDSMHQPRGTKVWKEPGGVFSPYGLSRPNRETELDRSIENQV